MQKTIAEPVDASIYKDNNKDPQQQISKDPHRSILLLDSRDNPLQTDKTNINFSTVKNVGDSPDILTCDISRFKIDAVTINYVSPNINPYNNVVTFFSTFSLAFHTVTLTEGFYSTPVLLLNELITQLNSVGASGLSFTATLLSGGRYQLLASGGMYFFDLNSLAMMRVQPLALPRSQIATSSKIGGTLTANTLFYTRYIDIVSPTISAYEKIRTVSTNLNNNIICRIYLQSGNTPQYIVYFNTPNISYNYLDIQSIYTINMQLRDEFGNALYIPSTENDFNWGIGLILEY